MPERFLNNNWKLLLNKQREFKFQRKYENFNRNIVKILRSIRLLLDRIYGKSIA